MDFSTIDPRRLDALQLVVDELTRTGELESSSIMVVGAEARDILHAAHSHDFALRGTTDIDIGVAIDDWAAHDSVMSKFQATGNTGIRYRVADVSVDVMPFGKVEDPVGEVLPARRRDSPFSVFAFSEVFDRALTLELPSGHTIKVPSSAGYAALKMRAWRDRWTASFDEKDGPDLATSMFWYFEDDVVSERLWNTDDGQSILEAVGHDYPRAAAQLLGMDVAETIGKERALELSEVWVKLDASELAKAFGHQLLPSWTTDRQERSGYLESLGRGLVDPHSTT